MDTIVALSTPAGRGGICVVRLSGKPLGVAEKIFHSKALENSFLPAPNYMYFGRISTSEFSDLGYMVYFRAPKSYTGEDVVEFHLHGGTRIAEGVIGECVRNGARLAERGEFTRRAFLNGKMELSDAEGVIDMINADSAGAVRSAYRLMTGKLSLAVHEIQNRLSDVLTGLSAVLDYPEELEDETLPEVHAELIAIREKLKKFASSGTYGKMIKEGMDVALVGDTNVGKSSLMNAMLGYDRAIVSDIRGTTRDFVTDSFELNGKKINLADTAGIRQSDDVIEKEGVNRAISIIKDAKLIIRVFDATEKPEKNDMLDEALAEKNVIEIYNKCDLKKAPENAIAVSAKTGDGMDVLMEKISDFFDRDKTDGEEILTSERQLSAVLRAIEKTDEAISALEDGIPADCVISVLNEAWSALGEITGQTVSEKIIDDIFDKFCVGK